MADKNSLTELLKEETTSDKLGKSLNDSDYTNDSEPPEDNIVDVTPVKTADEIQEASESANWSQVVDDDGNKPDDNADVTADNTAGDVSNISGISANNVIYYDILSGKMKRIWNDLEMDAAKLHYTDGNSVESLQPAEANADVTDFDNVKSSLAAADDDVDFNSQRLTGLSLSGDKNDSSGNDIRNVSITSKKVVRYSNSSPLTVLSTTDEIMVTDVNVIVTEAFDGSGKSFYVGDNTDPDGFVTDIGNSELEDAGLKTSIKSCRTAAYFWNGTCSTIKHYPSGVDIKATFGGTSMTQGIAYVYVTYIKI